MAAYDTYVNADLYFAERLHVQSWTGSTVAQKTIALTEASARIDRLRFIGEKVDDDQALEFPRYEDDTEDLIDDDDITIACYEVAYALLDGVDPDLELENLAVSARGISSARTTYDRGEAPEHFAAGIPSAYAWSFLRPFLRPSGTVKIRRVS
jgi:hypothetical protein